MGPGGAQKVAACLLNHWVAEGRKLRLITLNNWLPDAVKLDSRIERVTIDSTNGRSKGRTGLSFLLQLLRLRAEASPVPHEITKGLEGLSRRFRGFRQPSPAARMRIVKFLGGALSLPLGSGKTLPARVQLALLRFGLSRASASVRHQLVSLRWLLRTGTSRAVLSFLGATNVKTLLAGTGIAERVVISERNDPSLQRLSTPWEQLRRCLYGSADVVTANSKGALKAMEEFVASEKLVYIPNPVTIPAAVSTNGPREKAFLAVARLVEQKGLDVLIRAFARVAEKLPGWRLDLVGEGPLRGELERLAQEAGVLGRVIFHGYRRDVGRFYERASVFVLSSRYEGTPNALMEAMAYGLPAVVSDASPGPLELVSHSESGLVFPSGDECALGDALVQIAGHPGLQTTMGAEARRALRSFEVPAVAQQWDRILYVGTSR